MIGITVKQGTTTLADGTETGGQLVGDVDLNHRRIIEVIDFIRAIQVLVRVRGNRRNVLSLTVDRVYADLLTARAAQLGAGESVEELGDLVLIFTDGSSTLTATLSDAGWEELTPKYYGLSVETTYKITGGAFALVASGATSPLFDGSLRASATTLILAGAFDNDARSFCDVYDCTR